MNDIESNLARLRQRNRADTIKFWLLIGVVVASALTTIGAALYFAWSL
jgi:hypothetical protein